jgi:hypothetical protein
MRTYAWLKNDEQLLADIKSRFLNSKERRAMFKQTFEELKAWLAVTPFEKRVAFYLENKGKQNYRVALLHFGWFSALSRGEGSSKEEL